MTATEERDAERAKAIDLMREQIEKEMRPHVERLCETALNLIEASRDATTELIATFVEETEVGTRKELAARVRKGEAIEIVSGPERPIL